jgi:cell division GTPase FtsZ
MTVIIAVGCAGGRMVNKIISAGRIEAEYLAINMDRRVVEACLAGHLLPLAFYPAMSHSQRRYGCHR